MTRPAMPPIALVFALLTAIVPTARAGDTTIGQQLAARQTEAGQAGDPARGQAFFTRQHGGAWSCASCHGQPPTRPGRHADTGKTLDPLAPAVNPLAFTDSARTQKWFRRNCKDVLSRECTAAEKADVLAYLNSLR